MDTFNKADPTPPADITPPAAPPAAPDPAPFDYKVGERVFHSKEDLDKHILNAQEHIATLETENTQKDQLISRQSDQIQQGKTLEDVVKQLSSTPQAGTPEPTAPVSKDELVRIATDAATSAIREERTTEQANANWNVSLKAAQDAFSEPDKAIADRAKELGEDFAWAEATAKANPALFRALFIPETQPAPGGSALSLSTQRAPAGGSSDGAAPAISSLMQCKTYAEKKAFMSAQMKAKMEAAGLTYS